MSKGISPLIASVLLLAFTMSIAVLAGPFFSNTMQNVQGDTADRASDISSQGGEITIDDVAYDTGSGNYTITIMNTGQGTIGNFTTTLYGDKPVQMRANKQLPPGGIERFEISTDKNLNFTRMEVQSDMDSPGPITSAEKDLGDNVAVGEAPSAPTGLSASTT